MIDKTLFEDLHARINEALRNSPAADFEKNVKAILGAWFDKLDLVEIGRASCRERVCWIV